LVDTAVAAALVWSNEAVRRRIANIFPSSDSGVTAVLTFWYA
jgi:hypothetical protein